jgi:hypothetical protein
MYEAGRWVAADDPLGRAGQERLVGELPDDWTLITVATEWVLTSVPGSADPVWCRRPISSWRSLSHEIALWDEEFGDA